MLFEGIEIVVRQGTGEGPPASARSADPSVTETWRRVRVAPGIELHLCEELPKPGVGEVEGLLVKLERALRKHLR